jgi:hypothetical protein
MKQRSEKQEFKIKQKLNRAADWRRHPAVTVLRELEISSNIDRRAAKLRTISSIDDEKDQSFQDSFKRLRSLLIGQQARFACLETIRLVLAH